MDKPVNTTASLFCHNGVIPDIIYKQVDGIDLKLDLWLPRVELGEEPWIEYDGIKKPVLLYIHGGGFENGDKMGGILGLLPFIQRNWAVISLNYRVAEQAKAPAAVEDCLDGLAWIFDNHEQYQLDLENLVVAGTSAGGHLAMMSSFLKSGDSLCQGKLDINRELPVKAVINWYGPSILVHPDGTPADLNWLPNGEEKLPTAIDMSPLNHLSPKGPPVISIHGTEDKTVEYIHSHLLTEKMKALKIPHRLVTIQGGKHGAFSPEEREDMYHHIWVFLKEQGIKTWG